MKVQIKKQTKNVAFDHNSLMFALFSCYNDFCNYVYKPEVLNYEKN